MLLRHLAAYLLYSLSLYAPNSTEQCTLPVREAARGSDMAFLRDKAILLIFCSPDAHMPYSAPHSIPLLASLSLLLSLSPC